ncbi:chaplin [Streptomyces pharetrae]|uniref:chaplin n=1 Tax=Streptomyces pharetrae TaxID=291370 RepID=UPI000A331582
MRRTTRNGVIAVAAASGAMAVAFPVSAAFAADGAGADGTATGSPGVLSGNALQVPVHVPVNVCGNTANVVGLLNPAAGNTCVNGGTSKADGAKKSDAAKAGGAAKGSGAKTGGAADSGGSVASGGASAHGVTEGSPGVLSGNNLQLPIDLPVNVSGNSVNVVGVGNPAIGNESVNDYGDHAISHTAVPKPRAPKPPATPDRSHVAPQAPRTPHAPHATAPSLAHTGADLTAPALAGSLALIVTGGILYRRFSPGRTR